MKKLNYPQRFVAFVVDATIAIFIYQIIALLLSYFYFIPMFPGIWIVWILYYIVAYLGFRTTVGESLFNAGIVVENRKVPVSVRIIVREVFTSFPALFFWPMYMCRAVSPLILLILLILIILRCFMPKLSGIVLRRSHDDIAIKRSVFVYTPCAIYLLIIIAGCVARLINICATGDRVLSDVSILNAVPRPSVHSVEKYTDFLINNRQDINDYVLGLFDEYDHVILCERHHQEMTQYEMIYNLVTDSRFVDKVGVVFTEIGCVESRDAYKEFVDKTFTNDSLVDKNLASFMMSNQALYLLWPNTNWFEFLKKMYFFNHGKTKKVDILFADKIWKNEQPLGRDSVMADNIVSTVESDSINKSMIIMNYRHAYLTPDNCGYFIERKYPGKVANVLIDFGTMDLFFFLMGKEIPKPIHNGSWRVAFEQIQEEGFAFDFKDSPFGRDAFDHFVIPRKPEAEMKYQDMFTGFIYYKSPSEQYKSLGFNHLFDEENVAKLKEREKYVSGYSLESWDFLRNGLYVEDGKDIYGKYPRTLNIIFLCISIFSIVMDGVFFLILYIRHKKQKGL